jgi:cytochrome b6-f complex iron-sulfur subunit
MKRRKLLGWFGFGAVISYLLGVLNGCAKEQKTTTQNTRTPDANGFVALGTVKELSEKGSILDTKNSAKPILVVRDSAKNNLVAVNPLCTHQGCTVGWDNNKRTFVCPCHGSEFGIDGKVIKEPADKPLPTFETKEENGSVLVKVV